MPILTLTSDLGSSDAYVAGIKGRLLTACADAVLVDVTHEVTPFQPASAAFFLGQVWADFPTETIHWIGVDSGQDIKTRNLIVMHQQHFFVGADNGIFSMLFDTHPEFVFAINEGVGEASGIRGMYPDLVLAASWLAAGKEILEIASQQKDIRASVPLTATASEDMIQGTVIHIDRFGNVLINITRTLFDKVGQGRPFELRYRRRERIDRLSMTYADVPQGERLCRFNESAYLEIAINHGRASDLLGLHPDDSVQLVFG